MKLSKETKRELLNFLKGQQMLAKIDRQHVEYDDPDEVENISDDDDKFVYGWWNGLVDGIDGMIEVVESAEEE